MKHNNNGNINNINKMLNNTQFSVLYPNLAARLAHAEPSDLAVVAPRTAGFLAQFNQGTYTRVRRGKTELVRKKKKKRSKLAAVGGTIVGGLGGAGALRIKAIQEAKKLGRAASKIDPDVLNDMSQKQVNDFISKNSGTVLKTATSKYGGLKLAAIPLGTAIAGGVAAYKFSRRKKKKR